MSSRSFLSFVLVVLVAFGVACGNDGDGADTSQAGEAAAFCEEFSDINAEGEAAFEAGNPEPSDLRDLVDRARALEPPAAIADDYDLVVEAQGLFTDAIEGDTSAQEELQDRSDEFEAADEALEPFMRDECGLEYGD